MIPYKRVQVKDRGPPLKALWRDCKFIYATLYVKLSHWLAATRWDFWE